MFLIHALQASVFGSGHGGKRTYEQLCLLASTGREARARARARNLIQASGEALEKMASEVNESLGSLGSAGPQMRATQVSGRRQFSLCSSKNVRFVGGRRSQYKLSPSQMCQIAFNKRSNHSALADANDCSAKTVRRTVALVGHTLLETQLALLHEFRDFMSRKPHVAACCFMFDETSQVLSLDALHGTTRPQQRSTWEVLVARLNFTVGFLGGTGLKMHREIVFPPVPLLSNSAAAINSGLFERPLAGPLIKVAQEVLAAAKISCMVFESDGHLANEKLFYHRYRLNKLAWEGRQDDARHGVLPPCMEHMLCGNHQTNLVLTAAVEAAPKTEDVAGIGKLVPNLYASALFLRMGGHWLKLAFLGSRVFIYRLGVLCLKLPISSNQVPGSNLESRNLESRSKSRI